MVIRWLTIIYNKTLEFLNKEKLKRFITDWVNKILKIKGKPSRPTRDEEDDYLDKPRPPLKKENFDWESGDEDKYNNPGRNEALTSLEYGQYNPLEIVDKSIKEPVKTVLIVDDTLDMRTIYTFDMKSLVNKYSLPVYDYVKFAIAISEDAGFRAYSYLNKHPVDYALLDITLGYSLRVRDDLFLEIDGVDIAIGLLKNNPNTQIRFVSGHSFNRSNYHMQYYFQKFERFTGTSIEPYLISKINNRTLDIYEFLKDVVK